MKKMFLLMAFAAMTFANAVKAQTIPSPEFMNEVYGFDKASASLVKLEKAKASFTTKAKMFGPAATGYEVKGDKSAVVLSADNAGKFVVSLSEASGDPTGWFTLYKAESKDGKRKAVMMTTKIFSGKTSSPDNVITYNIKKTKNAFEMVPSNPLEKGEYFFVAKGTAVNYGGQAYDVFAFAVE